MTFPTLDEVRQMIEKRPRDVSLETIAEAVGRSEAWVKKLASGDIPKPGYDAVIKVVEFLDSKK